MFCELWVDPGLARCVTQISELLKRRTRTWVVVNVVGVRINDELRRERGGSLQCQLWSGGFGAIDIEQGTVDFVHDEKCSGHASGASEELPSG